jgi:hypothetical protein
MRRMEAGDRVISVMAQASDPGGNVLTVNMIIKCRSLLEPIPVHVVIVRIALIKEFVPTTPYRFCIPK